MWPKRQIDRAAAQVTMNMPTMMNPAVLMLKLYMMPQKPLCWLRPLISYGSRPRVSIPAMNRQTATESPVIAML